jgi:hypothetical protein
MPNPPQPELARSRRSAAVTDDAVPAKAQRRPRKGATLDAPGPIPEDNAPGHQPDVVPDKPLLPPEPYRLHAADDVRGPTADDDGDRHGQPVGQSVRFAFLFEPMLVPFAAAVGVLPRTTSLVLDDDELSIRFGPWSLRTPRANIAGAEVTGPYRALKVAGPPHLSLRDRGITFATNRRAGTCIRFHEPVTALLPYGDRLARLPFGGLRHPAATVTVTNPNDLANRLGG